ncbi:MAG TPA: TAXI family TRAP transporter solute-binding subunit [Rhizomicrobium sp.]|nr:TAXI family TRAP transporter solute-binding subunit [Rhizomicrobium sp.]
MPLRLTPRRTAGAHRLAASLILAFGLTSGAYAMEWLAGPQGGGWYAMADGLSKLIDQDNPELGLRVVPGGGKENPGHLQEGDGQVGMSIDFLVAAAYAGKAPYDGAPMKKINTLGAGWSPLPFHLLRAANAPADLRAAVTGRGFRIAVPAKDTSDELTFQRVMAFYDTSYDRIERDGGLVIHGNYDEIAAALKDGKVDYLFGATTKPAAIIASIGEGPRPMALTPMPADLMGSLAKTYGYGRGVIPAGTYPKLQSGDIETTFMETIFMISAEVPEETAYKITRTLLTHRAELAAINASMADFDPKTAWRNLPAPLHPGAARAYRELGFMP